MKYIRTKDGKILPTLWQKFDVKDIIKQANTIEELCDEFVFEILTDEIEEPMYRDIHCARIDIKTQLKIYDDNMMSVRAIYGAIWTDKGLIYVAKMNEKGEFELL